jgi:hypothetical protein
MQGLGSLPSPVVGPPLGHVASRHAEPNRPALRTGMSVTCRLLIRPAVYAAGWAGILIEPHSTMEHVRASQRALRAGSAGLATSGHPGCAACRIRIGRACYIETIRAALAPEVRRAG